MLIYPPQELELRVTLLEVLIIGPEPMSVISKITFKLSVRVWARPKANKGEVKGNTTQCLFWLAVKEFKISYHKSKTILFTIYPYYGNLKYVTIIPRPYYLVYVQILDQMSYGQHCW